VELIDKEKLIFDLMNHSTYKPMKIKELEMILEVPKTERALLEETLNSLIKKGKIIKTKKGKFVIPKSINLITGKYISNQKGFGFVEVEDREEDIFIPGKYSNGAFHSDIVAVRLIKKAKDGKRTEGEVIEIISRGINEIVGTYHKNTSFGFVVPDNKKISKDIFISKNNENNAVTGHKVVVKMINFGSEDKKPEGEIIEILGHISDPGTDIMSIVRAYEIPTDFDEDVMHALDTIKTYVDEDEMMNRLDIRDVQTVTIDGEDAKDLDDAITIKKNNEGYELGVHIADVTNYVTEGSPLDKEAIKRGTSVYLVDRVIPMLPRKLSNGICSLNQGEPRLALSCIMTIDNTGTVVSHRIEKTVINVDRRMTYTNVKKILEEQDEAVREEYRDFIEMFETMEELAIKLRRKRKNRGSIDFDFKEAKIILNEKGEPIDIKAYDRNVATKIIEEFMLLANETVAENFYWQQVPFLYRNHEEPSPERIENLSAFIYNFGYKLKGKNKGEIHPKELQKLLLDIEGSNEETIISRLTLRSMKKAEYGTTSEGHFGLATSYYSHFTSPIRRYPDLQIHRIMKESISGELIEKRIAHYEKILPGIAKSCSEYERRAEEAERETEKLKKVEYMKDKIGEVFEGVISGVKAWGLYVELENTIEGLIHVTALKDDYYIFDEDKHCFIGERTSKLYKLGDVVHVFVASVSKEERTIDFELAKDFDNVNNH
jgi:ribonuclease R